MRWSWKLGRVAGIELRVHVTFVLLFAWLVGAPLLSRQAGVGEALVGGLLTASVFGFVVLHELGHALMARRFGIPTRDITLLPMGGVARLERMPREPRQELLVALAGPFVNVVAALALFAGIAATDGPGALVGGLGAGSLAVRLFWVNVSMALFNLLPAFPMDGGRVLRAVLAARGSRLDATRTAAKLGRWLALGLGALGLFGNPMLLLVAFFVWSAASSELAHVEAEAAEESAWRMPGERAMPQARPRATSPSVGWRWHEWPKAPPRREDAVRVVWLPGGRVVYVVRTG